MAQYEEGPEARDVESGFALDNLLKQNKAAATQQARGFGVQQAQTQQQHANRLDELLQGEKLKEQFADREAERSVPFIQQMISGNPQTAKSLGFGQNVTTPGELPVPEAGYAGTPDTSAWQPRQPTREEAMGLARAVPGIAKTLVENKLAAQSKPMVVGDKSALVDPTTGAVIYKNSNGQAVFSEADADRTIAENIKRDPSLQGRITKQGPDANGNWKVSTAVTEQASETPSLWLAQSMDVNRPQAERERAGALYDKWNKDQAYLAGQKAFQANINTPYNAEDRKRQDTLAMTIQSAYELQNFTAKEREQFTGAGKLGYEAARVAMEAGSPWTGNYTPEEIKRFSDFKKWNGMVEQYKFAIGGKQLTTGEQKVVEAFIPTGRELTTSEYEAKLRTIAKVMEAAQAVDQYLAVTGKINVSPEAQRNIYRAELAKRGINVDAKPAENVQQEMTPGQRLRNKYGQP